MSEIRQAGTRLADRFQHGRGQGVVRRLAAPQHEHEGGKIALALVQRHLDQVLDLPGRGSGAGSQQKRVPEHHKSAFGRIVEMPEPQAFVDQSEQRTGVRQAMIGNPQVEGAGKLHRAPVFQPRKPQVITVPVSLDVCRELVVSRTISGPLVGRHEPLDDIERVRQRGSSRVNQTGHGWSSTMDKRRRGDGSVDTSSPVFQYLVGNANPITECRLPNRGVERKRRIGPVVGIS